MHLINPVQLPYLEVVVSRRQVERRGVPALGVATVDVVVREEPLHALHVALLRGVQQGRVAAQKVTHVLLAVGAGMKD